ncbi:MAG: pantetheine-phosphate adenylyltransferase [Peptoniphilaceae bacterium]|uniref:pantetheine-phosphate adenylyltransferase n=1 Tax=Parvimonas sp. TaxID=1944660 RepID=UPI0025D01945|nr:pantetheine-phosphate adenylyltransferase [Parvimonas sp.]MCI5997506.1 pantetheine-phosphate adenylyltransferase [Parvimonas sp.]MDD7764615.1 pantetheine-phosphate adenylyltransferase [Peptoniphilaceae bacterium]MDY3050591.1 pantetheine-phosphate adenylyltransferase [Parvimonas sp.]
MKVIFPGSFDPITNGHIDIILRSLKIFDTVEVLVLNNFNKNTTFSIEEREDIISKVFINNKKIKVCSYNGLLYDYINKEKVDFIIRGIRNTIDYENEKINASVNREHSNVETLLMFSDDLKYCVSSSLVKELYFNGADVSKYVDNIVLDELNKKFRRNE